MRSSDAKVPFVIKVIDSEEVNAMALPGGFFYVNTGLIRAASEEAELAGVMAHEIAHVAARHSTEQVSKGRLLQLCLAASDLSGWPGRLRHSAGGGSDAALCSCCGSTEGLNGKLIFSACNTCTKPATTQLLLFLSSKK